MTAHTADREAAEADLRQLIRVRNALKRAKRAGDLARVAALEAESAELAPRVKAVLVAAGRRGQGLLRKPETMAVVLWARGSTPEAFPVTDLAHASSVATSFQDAQGYGASDLDERHGLVLADGQPMARISYNGRIWNLDGSERGAS